jgi:hypothetical protein
MYYGFTFSFPLWVLVHESIADDATNFSQLLLADCSDGSKALHLFTDEDLAERFARENGGNARPRALLSIKSMTTLLDALAKIGCDHFTFDAADAKSVTIAPVSLLRETLKQYQG